MILIHLPKKYSLSLKSTEQQWRANECVSPIFFSDEKDMKFCLNNYLGFLLCIPFFILLSWKLNLLFYDFWKFKCKMITLLKILFSSMNGEFTSWCQTILFIHSGQLDLLLRLVAEIWSNLASVLSYSAHGLFLKPKKNENPHKLVWASVTIFFILVFYFSFWW